MAEPPFRWSSMHHQAAPLLCHQHALQLQDQRVRMLDKQILSENFAICLLGGPRGASVTERVLTADDCPRADSASSAAIHHRERSRNEIARLHAVDRSERNPLSVKCDSHTHV